MKWTTRFMVAAGAAGLGAFVLAAPASAALDKCQKSIEKEGIKLESKLIKALQKCKDFYRKEVVKKQAGKSTKFKGPGGVGEKCAKQLAKTYLFPDSAGKSAMQKAFDKLLKLVPSPVGTATPGKEKCTDADLTLLGHLETSTWGDKFARWILVAKLKGAYYQQVWLVRDVQRIFQMLAEVEGTDTTQTTDCDSVFAPAGPNNLCEALTEPPCFEHACVLGDANNSDSATCVDGSGVNIPVNLTGVSIFEFCDVPDVLPGEFAIIGSPSKGINPVPLGNPGFACVEAIGGEGYVEKCQGGTNPTVSYSACMDHMLQCSLTGADCADDSTCTVGACSSSGNPCHVDADCKSPETCVGGGTCDDECQTSIIPGAICSDPVPDPYDQDLAHAGKTNGGGCILTSSAASAPGEAFVLNTTKITVVGIGINSPNDLGTDGTACTDDDTAPPGLPATIPLTTANANAVVMDDKAVDGNTLPDPPNLPCPNGGTISGTPFNCAELVRSVLTGGVLAGSFPALHGLFADLPAAGGQDTVTTFKLSCL